MTTQVAVRAPARVGWVVLLVALLAGVAGTDDAWSDDAAPSVVRSQASRPMPAPNFADVVNARMGLSRSTFVRVDVNATPGVAPGTMLSVGSSVVSVGMAVGDRLITLELAPHSVRAADFRVFTSDADGVLTEIAPAPERSYRGVVVGDPGSFVAASIQEDGLSARIMLGDGGEYWTEPVTPQLAGLLDVDDALARSLAGLHVVYQREDIVDQGATCGNGANLVVAANHALATGGGGTTSESTGAIAQIAFDVDSFYVDDYGTGGSQTRIEAIVNMGLNVVYPRDVQITYEITTFIFRLERVYFAADIFEMLNLFQERWLANHTNVVRDVAELFTGENLSGSVIGVATFASICTDEGFNVVENFGNQACRSDLSAHELGHNWGAQHCNCPENTMNPSITCTLSFHPEFTVPSIIAVRNNSSCLRPDNDLCANAAAIGDGLTKFDTIVATTDGGFTDCGLIVKDLWYRYTPSCTGTATASTCDADFDSRLAVYEADACPGSFLACNDDACDPGSSVSWPVSAGTTYLVRVGGNNQVGGGTLVLECVEADCPADLDMSGSVDFGDIVRILAVWGESDGPEDLDMNGTIDFGDIVVVLAAWGPCV